MAVHSQSVWGRLRGLFASRGVSRQEAAVAGQTPLLLSPIASPALSSPTAPSINAVAIGMQPSLLASDLAAIVHERNTRRIAALGGLDSLARRVITVDPALGIEPATPPARASAQREALWAAFGRNRIPQKDAPRLWVYIVDAMRDKMLLLLMGAAAVSIAIGVYEALAMGRARQWLEGVAILLAVAIVVLVNGVNDYNREVQFRMLSLKAADRDLSILDGRGASTRASIEDLAVGDVVLLEAGEIIPCDGVLIEASNCKCDESGMTGESRSVTKCAYDAVDASGGDPFVLSGTKVVDGTARMVVLAVGASSFHGRIAQAMVGEAGSATPLQVKLDVLAERIAKVGLTVAGLMFVCLFVKYAIELATGEGTEADASAVLGRILLIVIETITIIVVAVPEGLPMAVTLSLAYAARRMIDDANLVRVMAACETMGTATCICSDKTGTITENRMAVVEAVIGEASLQCGREEAGPPLQDDERLGGLKAAGRAVPASSLHPAFRRLLCEAVWANSTAFKAVDSGLWIGSQTEGALLDLANGPLFAPDGPSSKSDGQKGATAEGERSALSTQIIAVVPFSSERKSMTSVVEGGCAVTAADGVVAPADSHQRRRVYCKGASEIVLERCTTWIASPQAACCPVALTAEERRGLLERIAQLGSMGLRTLAIAFRDVSLAEHDEFVSARAKEEEAGGSVVLHTDLTLIAIVGIEDPIRQGVVEAVARCQRAGIFVRMVTGDNVATAEAIARRCGILHRGGLVMEGSQFRALSEEARDRIIPRLQVLARSSPLDKQVLVKRLRAAGHIVAVTGDGANDGPALCSANVSFAMGIAGTQVAKEASSIVLLDDNFASIVRAVAWGRCVSENVRKFLQFQLTVNVSAVLVAFSSALINEEGRSVLTTVELLWINLIMDTLGALALSTERPTERLLERQAESSEAPLISAAMGRMIVGQAAFQAIVILTIYLAGGALTAALENGEVLSTFVFNVFVFMQLFNEVNCRVIDMSLNVFDGLVSNVLFQAIWMGTVLAQWAIVTFGGAFFGTVPLSPALWAASVAIGSVSLIIALVIKGSHRLALAAALCGQPPRATAADGRVVMTRERLQWQGAIGDVRRRLALYGALRRAQGTRSDGG